MEISVAAQDVKSPDARYLATSQISITTEPFSGIGERL